MRRLLCVTAFLLLGAGCSAEEPAATPAAQAPAASAAAAPAASGAATGSASDPASPGSGDTALAGNSAAICQQAAKTGADAAKNFAQDVKLLIEAQSAQDADRVATAQAKTARDVQNYSYALTDMSKLASEPALKAALADMGKQVTALKGDVMKIDAGQLTRLQETLDRACGKS